MLRSRITLVAGLLSEGLGRALTKTGEDLAEKTRENMTPGHFFYTGLSRDGDTTGPASEADKERAEVEAGDNVGTVWEQMGPLHGRVHVKTPWAGFAEFGTPERSPRPALTPAVDEVWPTKIYEHAAEEMHG